MLLTPVHVLIADRNAMSSELLAESLGRHSQFKVVPMFPATNILSVPIQRDPTVAIVSADLDSGPQKGVYLARALRARHPQLAIVILLESLEREHVIASFRAGAKAVFCRDRSATELQKCIDCVAQGRLWIGSVEADYVLEAIQSAPSCDGMGDMKKLSAREGLVAELAAQGLSNKQIAHRLSLSEHTVKNRGGNPVRSRP